MLDFGLPQRLRGAYLLLQRRAAHFLSEFGVSGDQYFVLHVLTDEDRLTQQELARRCFTDPSSMTGMVDRMEKRGLVRREMHETDRRSRRVVITDEGRTLHDACQDAIVPVRTQLLEAIGSEDAMNETIDRLDRVIATLADHNHTDSLPRRAGAESPVRSE